MMAMGKAIIVGLNNETKWLIDSNVCLGVELCNAAALAECISDALENSERVRQIEQSAREFINTTYQSRFNERFTEMLKRAGV
jgi:glycosyltransferase involved in cell wall biosynthesis